MVHDSVQILSKRSFFAFFIFIGLTILFTSPGIFLIYDHYLGNNGDPNAYLWEFWWYDKAIHSGTSPFVSNYMFYPVGINFIQLTPYNSISSVILHTFLDFTSIYNLLLLSNFVLSGFTAYLLCNYLTKNFPASIIGGIIFSFSSYHMFHGVGHLELSTIQWIPLTLLFLIKTVNSGSKKNPILTGIFMFLNTISSWYLGIFLFIGIIPLIIYFFSKQKFSRRFFLQILLIFLVYIILLSPFIMLLRNSITSHDAFSTSLSEQDWYAADLTNFVRIPPMSTISHLGLVSSSFAGNSWEAITFLGYIPLGLSFLALIKIERAKTIPWLIIAIVLSIVCLGPFLKIFGLETNLKLPDYYIFQVPFFNFFRVLSRAVVIVTIAMAVLASLGVNYVLSTKLSSRKKLIITILITSFLIVESLTIPFPAASTETSEIYHDIKNKNGNFAVLEAPIGGPEGNGLLSDYSFDYYQTIHEKPMYGGYWARVPLDAQNYVQTYFLNKFVYYNQQGDIVDQNLNDVGISILNYFNIGYVIIHKQTPFTQYQNDDNKFVSDVRKTLLQIFDNKLPDHEDSNVISYAVPISKSNTPFILLGNGWSHLYADNSRTIGNSSIIKIINPGSTNRNIQLNFELVSVLAERNLVMYSNSTKFTIPISPNQLVNVTTNDFIIKPGENLIYLKSDGPSLESKPTLSGNSEKFNLIVKKIRMEQSQKISGIKIIKNMNTNNMGPLVEFQLNEIYYKMLGRGIDKWGIDFFEPKIQNNAATFQWVEDVLKDSPEHKKWLSTLSK